MTDPDESARQQDQASASVPPAPPTPPASPYAPPSAYDGAPYVAPAAPRYDSEPAPTVPPPYAPPAYPTAPTAPYGAPSAGNGGAYGAHYPVAPVQQSPGAPPVAPYGYGAYGAYGAPVSGPKTNGLAITSLVLSILGIVWILPFIGSLAGAILGHVAMGQIARNGDGGRGLALTGIIVGWIGVAFTVLIAAFFVFVFAVSASSYSSYS